MTLTIHNVEQRSAEWHDLRRGVLTASVVASLLTPKLAVADNDTTFKMALRCAADRILGRDTEPSFTNDDMMRGILDEPLAVAKYAEHYAPVVECGFMLRDEGDWTLGYSPDGLVGDKGLIEVKCPRAKTHLATIITDVVPRPYMAQIQAGLLVSGREWCDYISYFGGLPLYVKRVHVDDEWGAAITAAAITFEANVTAMVTTYRAAAVNMPATESMEVVI